MKLRHLAIVDESVRPDEARVDAEVDEASPPTQDARGLANQAGEVPDVRVREHRDGRVEALVLERQRGRIRFDDLDAARTGQLELVP